MADLLSKFWASFSEQGKEHRQFSHDDALEQYRKDLLPYSGSNYKSRLSKLRNRESSAQMKLLKKLPRQNADAPANPEWDDFCQSIAGYAETADVHDQISKLTEQHETSFATWRKIDQLKCVAKEAILEFNQAREDIYKTECSELISHSAAPEAEAKKAYELVDFGSEFKEIPPLDPKLARAFCLLRNPPTKEELNTIGSENGGLTCCDQEELKDSEYLCHLVKTFASTNTGISGVMPKSEVQFDNSYPDFDYEHFSVAL